MLWGIWSLPCGWMLGALWAEVLAADASPIVARSIAWGAGVALAGLHLALARRRDDDPARFAQLAAAASVAWLALPAVVSERLGVSIGSVWGAALCSVALAAAGLRATRVTGPCPARRIFGNAVGAAGAGILFWAVVATAVAALGAPVVAPSAERAKAIYDLDAGVATRTLPGCAQRVDRVEVLTGSGARPRWSRDGAYLWYDARAPEGRRQIHRFEFATGATQCWTCGQPGNNVRPDPAPDGAVLVFDSDRHADGDHPFETEIYRVPARGEAPGRTPRRLTFAPGPDEGARIGPSAAVVAWSRGHEGRYSVVSATISQGHGGVRLRSPGALVSGGARWTTSLGWSPDARSLVVVRGNPYRALEAVRIDLATDEESVIARSVSGLGGVGFNADGGWLAVATTDRVHGLGVLPDWLGYVTAPWAVRGSLDRPMFRGTAISTGPSGGPLVPVDLGEVEDWGEPTGVALAPDGRAVVVGQRRPAAATVQERLVRLGLSCADDEVAASR